MIPPPPPPEQAVAPSLATPDGLRPRIHEVATRAINSVYGTDDLHAYMGLRIAQEVVDGRRLPWDWNRLDPASTGPASGPDTEEK